ncbi:MAG: hypothetical protein K0R94_798 [Burkholderiales bacterium]|jgi:hypothetical protein|nr:hypothetical protein [Burkholderiales bacterium]
MTNLAIRKNLELSAGWDWIKSAFYIFREYPTQFIILSILNLLVSFMPLFGAFMTPLFTARFAYIAQMAENGGQIQISTLFKDFFANITLVRLGFLGFSLNAIFLVGQYLLQLYFKQHGITINISEVALNLIFLSPLMILGVAMWLAPIICLNYPEIRPVTAMGLSLKVGLYNVTTFLLYLLLAIAFTLLALLPVGLGLFVWFPVMYITSYYVYKTTIYIRN